MKKGGDRIREWLTSQGPVFLKHFFKSHCLSFLDVRFADVATKKMNVQFPNSSTLPSYVHAALRSTPLASWQIVSANPSPLPIRSFVLWEACIAAPWYALMCARLKLVVSECAPLPPSSIRPPPHSPLLRLAVCSTRSRRRCVVRTGETTQRKREGSRSQSRLRPALASTLPLPLPCLLLLLRLGLY